MKQLRPGLLLLLVVFSLGACSFVKPRIVQRSFYYWKSNFQLTQADLAYLKQQQIGRIYLKFFDVTWSGSPIPAAEVHFRSRPPQHLELVPTIYITNQTLEQLPAAQVPDLAAKMSQKLRRMIAWNKLGTIHEVQLDCDWNGATRWKYFQLLKDFRMAFADPQIKLSATIRLHQIKYRTQTGIPPVDRGMLMFYNMTPVNRFATRNSILDFAEGKAYLDTLSSYPLPLDVALPVFSWGVIFQDRRFIGIANGFRLTDVSGNPDFKADERNYYRVKRNVYLHQTQLYRGDLLRIEESDYRVCMQAAQTIAAKLQDRSAMAVALFHFDSDNLRGYGDAQIADLYARFR